MIGKYSLDCFVPRNDDACCTSLRGAKQSPPHPSLRGAKQSGKRNQFGGRKGVPAQFSILNSQFSIKKSLLITVLLFSGFLFRGMAQEVNLNPDEDRNKQTVTVKLYDANEGDFLLDLPLTFHLNADNILFMIVGSDYELGGNNSVWMFDKTLDLNTFLKQNRNVGATKTFKKHNKELVRFYEQSENIEKYVLFDYGFERVQSSPKPVFFQVKDPAKPMQLRLRFYVASAQRDGMNLLTSEAGLIKIAVNIQKNN